MAIEIKPLCDNDLREFYSKKGIKYFDGCGCVVAYQNDKYLGFCSYYIDGQAITITDIGDYSDLLLADGILRSALHIADYNGIDNAFYGNPAPVELFKKLNFIKDPNNRALNIEKLHQSCCGC